MGQAERIGVFMLAYTLYTLAGALYLGRVHRQGDNMGALAVFFGILLWPLVALMDFIRWWSDSMEEYWQGAD